MNQVNEVQKPLSLKNLPRIFWNHQWDGKGPSLNTFLIELKPFFHPRFKLLIQKIGILKANFPEFENTSSEIKNFSSRKKMRSNNLEKRIQTFATAETLDQES